MKNEHKRIHQMCIYLKYKAKKFYKSISVNGKKENINAQQEPVVRIETADNIKLTDAFHEYIFNTVVDVIVSEEKTLTVKRENISKVNAIYTYLDVYPSTMFFILKKLENITLLKLTEDVYVTDAILPYFFRDEKGDIVYNNITVGELCNFVERKLLQANQNELLKKTSDIAMKHQITINSNLEKQKQ